MWQSEAADNKQLDDTWPRIIAHANTNLSHCVLDEKLAPIDVPMGVPTQSVMNPKGPVMASTPPVARKITCFKSRAKCVSSPRWPAWGSLAFDVQLFKIHVSVTSDAMHVDTITMAYR